MSASRIIPHLLLLVVSLANPAHATWPADGAPVATGPGSRRVTAVVADGVNGVFVAWTSTGPGTEEVFVQRLRSDGELTPGWNAAGVSPAPNAAIQGSARVVPDGAGGCYVAWDEREPDWFSVRVQHLLASGSVDPAWPSAGALLVQGSSGRLIGIGTNVNAQALTAAASGGCVALVSSRSFGCHDGFCVSGGSVDLYRVSAAGIVSPPGVLEPYCSTSGADATAIADGADGIFALTKTYCTGDPNASTASRFIHATAGGEAPIAIPASANPTQTVLSRTGAGTVLGGVDAISFEPIRYWFHWNPDGSPAAGSPAAGVVLPAAWRWTFAADPSASSIYVWEPKAAVGTLRGLRLDADGAISAGWPASGVALAAAPAITRGTMAATDGAGGAFAVWADERNGSSNPDLYATHVLASGALAAGMTPAGTPFCTSPGRQDEARIVALGPGVAIAVWQDGRSGTATEIYAQQLPFDVPVSATASLARAEVRPDRVFLEWRFSEIVPEVALERSYDGQEWSERARTLPGSQGSVTFEDTDVRPGESIAYRIQFVSDAQKIYTVPFWVEIPRAELAVRVMPPVSRDRLSLEVTLVTDEPALLELVDVAGRRLQSRDVSGLGNAPKRLELELRDVACGVAWLRLRQGEASRTLRVAIAR